MYDVKRHLKADHGLDLEDGEVRALLDDGVEGVAGVEGLGEGVERAADGMEDVEDVKEEMMTTA